MNRSQETYLKNSFIGEWHSLNSFRVGFFCVFGLNAKEEHYGRF